MNSTGPGLSCSNRRFQPLLLLLLTDEFVHARCIPVLRGPDLREFSAGLLSNGTADRGCDCELINGLVLVSMDVTFQAGAFCSKLIDGRLIGFRGFRIVLGFDC